MMIMKYRFLFAAFAFFLPLVAGAEDAASCQDAGRAPFMTNVYGRDYTLLNGKWNAIVDLYDQGRKMKVYENRTAKSGEEFYEYSFEGGLRLNVPGDWNSQTPELKYYEGTVWYARHFDAAPADGIRQFLYFGAVSYRCRVYLNGEQIAAHEGGFTPFQVEVTDRLKTGDNFVVVEVNNRRTVDAIPALAFDWWNYGGITRDVMLVSTPETFVEDYFIRLDNNSPDVINASVTLSDAVSAAVRIEIPELKVSQELMTDASGRASASFKVNRLQRWSPDTPKLYDVLVTSAQDTVREQIGFRNISVDGTQILVNGRPTFMRSISFHEEIPQRRGRAFSQADAVMLLSEAQALGVNMVRLAHYPHNEAMVRTAEEMGLMVWSEIPVYWTIQWENPQTYANAENQLEEMITRDRNRANVVIWSVANETPHGDARLKFLVSLISRAREMDDTRLVSAAMEKAGAGKDMLTVDDDLMDYVDLISFNQYVGWYDGTSEKCDRVNWVFDVQKPVFVSEFGAGCLAGLHGEADERFTEEYMADCYRRTVGMLDRMPGLAGTTPWVLKDFRSPRRLLVGIQDDFNRKGLVSDQGYRKPAFFIMKEWYGTK